MKMNIGRKIQEFSKIILIVLQTILGISGIIGVCMMIHSRTSFLIILLVIIAIGVSFFLIYFMYLLVIGFGRLVENSDFLADNADERGLRNRLEQRKTYSPRMKRVADALGIDLSDSSSVSTAKTVNTNNPVSRAMPNSYQTMNTAERSFADTKLNTPTRSSCMSNAPNVQDNPTKSGEEKKGEAQRNNRVCSKCGAPAKDGMQFCFKCGTPL